MKHNSQSEDLRCIARLYTVTLALPGVTSNYSKVRARNSQYCATILRIRVELVLLRMCQRDHVGHSMLTEERGGEGRRKENGEKGRGWKKETYLVQWPDVYSREKEGWSWKGNKRGRVIDSRKTRWRVPAWETRSHTVLSSSMLFYSELLPVNLSKLGIHVLLDPEKQHISKIQCCLRYLCHHASAACLTPASTSHGHRSIHSRTPHMATSSPWEAGA